MHDAMFDDIVGPEDKPVFIAILKRVHDALGQGDARVARQLSDLESE